VVTLKNHFQSTLSEITDAIVLILALQMVNEIINHL